MTKYGKIRPELRTLANEIAKQEKKEPQPSQDQLDKLYADIYRFILTQKTAAEKQKKPFLLIMGETHWTVLGKSPLIVNIMIVHAAQQLGITKLYLEQTPLGYETRLQLAKKAATLKREESADRYRQFENDMMILVHLLRALPPQHGLSIEPSIPSHIDESDQYNRYMSAHIREKNMSGILLTGLKHLQGLKNDKRLNQQYAVSLMAAPITDQVYAADKLTGQKPDSLLVYALTSPEVTRFPVTGRLIDTGVDELIAMTKKASKKRPALIETQGTHPIESKSASYSTIAHTSILSSNSPAKIASQKIGILPASSTTLSLYSQEKTPLQPMLTMLMFWFLNKTGICLQAPENAFSIQFSDASTATMVEERAREASAAKILSRQKTSLEDMSVYLFGAAYQKGTIDERQQIKAFIIDNLLGDVDRDTSYQLNIYGNIENDSLRHQHLLKLMDAYVKTSVLVGRKPGRF